MGRPIVYLHTSEKMPEVRDRSVALLVGGSVYLGKGVGWGAYHDLYTSASVCEGLRVVSPNGVLCVVQTNAYRNGLVWCRYHHLLKTLAGTGWKLIDEKVWERRRADHFQVPFSHVLVFRPPGGSATRRTLAKRCPEWFQGVWRFPQASTRGVPKSANAFPRELCDRIVRSCTDAGDLVVDPFAGTARLLARAASLGRRAVGYEIDAALVATIRQQGCEVRK